MVIDTTCHYKWMGTFLSETMDYYLTLKKEDIPELFDHVVEPGGHMLNEKGSHRKTNIA